MIARLVRTYPRRTAAMVLLLLLAGLAEGIGVASLLPLLETATETVAGAEAEAPDDPESRATMEPSAGTATDAVGDTAPGSRVSRAVESLVRGLGLEPTLGTLLALIVGALTLKAAFRWLALTRVGYGVAAVARDFRLRLVRGLLTARWHYFTGAAAGDIANAVGFEAYRSAHAYRRACTATAAAVQLAVYFALMLLLSWVLVLFAVVLGGTVALLLGGFVRAGRIAGERHVSAGRSLVARLVDVTRAARAVKAMGREAPHRRLLEDDIARLETAERRFVVAAESLQSLQEPIIAAAIAGGLYAAVAWAGQPIAALLVGAFLLHRMAVQLHQLQIHMQGLAGDAAAFHTLDALTRDAEAASEPPAEGEPPPALVEGIRFSGVRAAYDDTLVLRDASLTIPARGLTLLVGPSGAGKTTVLDLAATLLRPAAGRIEVDGVPLERIDHSAWRRAIGYVPQEPILLHDTVARNIAAGDDTIGADRIEAALRAAAAWDFVAALPDGADTVVGEQGWKLSGGQRQRLALARALVARPRLLILDEPTASVDADTAAAIRRTLRELRGAVTILIASHEPDLAVDADAVYAVEGGTVRERPRVAATG